MPAETVVVLTVVIAMFATFMVTMGGVWIWTNLPAKAERRPATTSPQAATQPA